MWNKSFRLVLLCGIYQYLFWKALDNTIYSPDWEYIYTVLKREEDETPDYELINRLFSDFVEQEQAMEELLKEYVKDWERTFVVIKACFFSFVIEYVYLKNNSQLPQEIKPFVNKYVRTSQDLAGGDNPLFVHAVISKLIEDGRI